jgi:hypothetical protein
MPSCPVHAAALTCHPESPGGAVRSIDVRVVRSPRGTLAVTFTLEGDLDRVRVPVPRPPRIAARLWQHTCCEIFIARKGLPAYHEFNLAPSGEWAAYAFERYRDGEPFAGGLAAAKLDPQVTVRDAAGKLELDALIRLDRLSPMHSGAKLSLALSAVVEDREGLLSYWALKHPSGKPDFHHADAFAMELAGADSSPQQRVGRSAE